MNYVEPLKRGLAENKADLLQLWVESSAPLYFEIYQICLENFSLWQDTVV